MTLLMRLLQQHYTHVVDAALRDAGHGDIRPGNAKVFPFVPPEGISVGEIAVLAGVRKQTMGLDPELGPVRAGERDHRG